MSEPPVVDIEAILAPIPGDQPGGVDPRDNSSVNSPYYRIKDARGAARAEERAALEADAPIPEAWGKVVDLGVDLLSTQAKDLEVATWLTEALVRKEGFGGLRDGLTVIAKLGDGFWDHSFPLPDEDGLEAKVSAVAGLSGSGATGTLDRPIRNMPLVDTASGSYSFWVYDQAVELEKIADATRRNARISEGTVTLEAFRQAVAETRIEALRDRLEVIGACEVALASATAALDAVAGVDSPSMTALQELLGAVGSCLRHVAADRLAVLAQQQDAVAVVVQVDGEPDGEPGASTNGAAVARRPGEFVNREEALLLLSQIVNYFRRTEPQSPISYTIEDAVRRARLSLPDLLKELAQDPSHMQHILLAAGIRHEEPDDQGY